MMAHFQYYLLPAEKCANALRMYEIAKEDGMRAKRDLLAKYGADAILRAEVKADALAWKEKPAQLPGFSAAQWSQKLGVWLQRPKRNTVQGRAAAQEMDEVCEILEIWQWSLERALGVDGSVFGWYGNARLFLNTTARPLSDGRVVLCVPQADFSDHPSDAKDAPKAPEWAQEISKQEAERLLGTAVA